jgi:hypothetical protein
MTKMSAVLRIKAELALLEASRKLLGQHAPVLSCPIPSREVQDARLDMIAAHKTLKDVQEITF